MNIKALVKDIIAFNREALLNRYKKLNVLSTRWLRLSFNSTYGKGKNLNKIPVIINNRNRITFLLKLIEWLEKNKFKNIYIIDNNSNYQPLLDYYKRTRYKVFRLNENVGHLALWKTGIYKLFKNDYYIYTDPDILPSEECPPDVIEVFMKKLIQFKNIDKIGFGLRIDDLPDCYKSKREVIDWEKQFWMKEVEPGIYDAEIDTTFALYKPYANALYTPLKSHRTGGLYIARHLPWYENSANPTEEEIFYRNNIRKGASHWIKGN